MQLSNLLNTEFILIELEASSKNEAFQKMINLVCKNYKNLNSNTLFQAVMEREEQLSTYLGNSLAVPHARIAELDDFIIVCTKLKNKIDNIEFIFMLLSSKTKMPLCYKQWML